MFVAWWHEQPRGRTQTRGLPPAAMGKMVTRCPSRVPRFSLDEIRAALAHVGLEGWVG